MSEELKGFGSALHQVGGCLIVSIHSDSDENDITRTGKGILNRLNQNRAKGVIIDVSDVAILSTNEFCRLKDLARSIAMMGTISIFSGFRPGVAASLVAFDAKFDDITTARNTDDAFRILTNHTLD